MNTTTIDIHYPSLIDQQIVDDTIGYVTACIEDLCTENGINARVTHDSTTITLSFHNADLRRVLNVEELNDYIGAV